MTWKSKTSVFILIMFVGIAVYDAIAISGGGTEASISHTMLVWSYKYPLFTFLMGVLAGHLFYRTRDTEETKKIAEDTRKE